MNWEEAREQVINALWEAVWDYDSNFSNLETKKEIVPLQNRFYGLKRYKEMFLMNMT